MNLRTRWTCLICLAVAMTLHGVWPQPLLAAPPLQAAALDAARAVVRIIGCNIQGCHEGVGSGVFIDPSGLILTAHHVTLTNPLDPLSEQLGDFVIEVTDNPRQAPAALYRARVVAQNPASDLALLQIYWDEKARHPLDAAEVNLPYIRLADPDSVQFGEGLAIFGYPLAGGHSINYASEGLSGFDADDGGTLLKVQKSLSEGNSGGPALVQRPDGYEIAGVVIQRRGTMGEVGLIRSIGELHDLEWAAGGRRAVVGNVALSLAPAEVGSAPVACLDARLFDLVDHSLRLLAYAYDGAGIAPYRVSDPNLPTTAGGQLVLAAEVAPAAFIERLGSHLITLDTLPGDLASAGLVYRLALWDVNTGQLLWSDSDWRQPQTQTPGAEINAELAACLAAAGSAAPPPSAAGTPTLADTPTATPTPPPPATATATASATSTPTATATATPVPQRCSVQVDSLNLRSGPGPAYLPPLAALSNHTALLPLGRNDAGTWILVQVESSGQEGWVSASTSYVVCDLPIADLPPVAPPPTPVPPTPLPVTPTPTPTPTDAAPLQVGVSASTGSGNNVTTFAGSGQTVYSDRGYTYSEAPGALAGMLYVQTANNDREHRDGDFWLNLDVNKPVRVYVAYSDGYTEKPGWLQSFGDTGLDLRFVDAMGRTVALSVFSQQFPAGRITLGANTPRNGDTHTMYTVFIAEDR